MHPAAPSSSSSGTLPARVLVVEDDPQIATAVSDLLEETGYAVETRRDGRAALERLRRAPNPDVIILDLMMPVLDGWEFRVQQRRDPALSGIPVLAMSADKSARAAAIDADGFLAKPFHSEQLLQTLEAILSHEERARGEARKAQRLATLGTLAAGAVHEISNPLTCIMAHLASIDERMRRVRDLASDGGEGPEVCQAIDDLQETVRGARLGSERVCGVVRSLQRISRRTDEPFHLVDVRSVLGSAVTLAAPYLRHCAQVRAELPDEGTLVRGSELRLGQLFTNLLINAGQAIGEGNAQRNEIRLSARTDERGLVVEVADTGPGMTAEVRGRIFEPFFTTKAETGTGLGLAISRSVVLEHHGLIEVESEPGRGSMFRVVLPLERNAGPAGPVGQDLRWATGRRRGRVLVVDDDLEVGCTIKRLLEPDHEVTPVTHGREAIDRLLWGQLFDVILCNVMMPFMNGERVHREVVEQLGPEVAERIVFVTGGALSTASRTFLDTVDNGCLHKPFTRDELRTLVAEMVAAAPAARPPLQ
jgi:two-component system cell cycle sensor histidine kinase/response regulator CckA